MTNYSILNSMSAVNMLVPFHSIALLHKANFLCPSLTAYDSLHESTLFTGFHVSLETPRSSSLAHRKPILIHPAGDVEYDQCRCLYVRKTELHIRSILASKQETHRLSVMSFFHVPAVCYSCTCLISERVLLFQVHHFCMLSSKALCE